MGEIVNQDSGDGVPVDAGPRLGEFGVWCVELVEDFVGVLATLGA